MTVGPLVAAVGLAMLVTVDPGDHYVTAIMPAVLVFGLGLAITVAPLTAAVLAAADAEHAGVASAVNNTVARVAGLLAVAALPALVGMDAGVFDDPAAMTHAFHVGMVITAVMAAGAGVLSWLTIRQRSADEPPARRRAALRAGGPAATTGEPLRRGLDEEFAAVDVEGLAGDGRGAVGCEEGDGLGDVLGGGDLAERHVARRSRALTSSAGTPRLPAV